MDGPPPLRDDSNSDSSSSSSEEAESPPLDSSLARNLINQFVGTERGHVEEEGDSSGNWNSDDDVLPPDRKELEEAADFALPRIRRSQRGLEVRSSAVRYVLFFVSGCA